MEILYYIILLVEIFLLSKIDQRYFKTYLTPLQVIAYPFLAILTSYYIFYKTFGFYKMNPNVLLIWIIGLFILWLPGFLIIFSGKKKSENATNSSSKLTYDFSNLMSLFVFITLPLLVLKFVKALKLFHGFKAIGYEKFTEYFGSGLVGHIMTIYIIIFVYLFAFSPVKNKIHIFSLIIIFFSFFLYQVKSWIFIPIISSLICRIYLSKIRLNLKFFSFLILISFFIFVSVYIFSFRRDTDLTLSSVISFYTNSIQFLFKHALSYCFSGILGLSGHIEKNLAIGEDKLLLINSLKNIYYSVIDKNEIRNAVTTYFVKMGNEPYLTSNVKTFFGSIYIFGGPLIGSIYIFFSGLFLYLNLIIQRYLNNPFLLILYSFFLSALFFGWFDFYFNGLTYIELPVYLILLAVCYDIIKRGQYSVNANKM